MFDFIGLRVRDLDRSVAFYVALLAPLGHVLRRHDHEAAGFAPHGEDGLWFRLCQGPARGGAHVAFFAQDPGAVDAFYAAGVAAGATSLGGPSLRYEDGVASYAAAVADLDGNAVEAVTYATQGLAGVASFPISATE